MEVPLQPLGKSDIHKLESVLLIATLFRKDVLEMIKNAEDRLTWVDSLAVAAAALARHKAGKSISEIAEELGRSEATIRRHLHKETEAGKLVWETYERLAKGELKDIIVDVTEIVGVSDKEEVKKHIEEAMEHLKEALSKL